MMLNIGGMTEVGLRRCMNMRCLRRWLSEDKRGWSGEKVRVIAYCEQCWIHDL